MSGGIDRHENETCSQPAASVYQRISPKPGYCGHPVDGVLALGDRVGTPSVLPPGLLGLALLFLVVGPVALLERGRGDRAGGAAVVVGLELLERLVEAVLVDRDSSEIRTQSDPSYASMLKISWSIEVESSTITTISVWGLK